MRAGADEAAVVGDGRVPVEIFRPEGEGPWPGLLVIHEVFGVNDDIRRICRRFAAEGYLAAAPNLLATSRIRCIAKAVQALQSGEGEPVDDLEELIAVMEKRTDVGKVGAVGFCMGGGFALLLGCRSESLGAAGVYYGETRPAEELAKACPLVGGYGAKDRLFKGKARKLVATLDELGKEHDIRIYEQAGHSYMNQAGHPLLAALSRPLMHVAYNEAAEQDSWRRMLAFFGEKLAA